MTSEFIGWAIGLIAPLRMVWAHPAKGCSFYACILQIVYIQKSEYQIWHNKGPIMETEFTPLPSLLGGGLIGASAVLLMATHGHIAGISGILSRMLPPASKDQSLPQSLIFLIGLLLAAPLWITINGQVPLQTVSNNLPLLALAGVLVGFGSVWGNGCTSGHGVCGISRLSGRSIVATLTFMSTGFVAVLLLRHVFGS